MGFIQLLLLALLIKRDASSRPLRSSLVLGWGFGLGAFVFGVSWLYISLHDYGDLPAILAMVSVVFFSAYLGLFAGFSSWAYAYVLAHLQKKQFGFGLDAGVRALTWAALWSFFEWVRGTLFTGFAWLSLGDALVDSPFSGLLPWLGSYGALFVVLFSCAWSLAWVLRGWRVRTWACGFAACVGVGLPWGGVLAFQLLEGSTQARGTVEVVALQTNVDQSIKFDPTRVVSNMNAIFEMAELAQERMSTADGVLIFPETVSPLIWNEMPKEWLSRFQGFVAQGTRSVLLGAALEEQGQFYNSILQLDGTVQNQTLGTPLLRHDKRHLVPFGEFVPWGFHWFVRLLNMPMGEFGRGTGALRPFAVGQGQFFAGTVCYEDTFSGEFARLIRDATQEPTVLLNLSNLAWFGQSWALDQHAQMGRVRSAEHRKPGVRVTNTGASGVIDERGQWIQKIEPGQRVVWQAQVSGRKGLTFFATHGAWVWYLMWIAALAAVFVRIVAPGAYNSVSRNPGN